MSSSTALTSGTYTAVAIEQSELGNAQGESAPVTFVVNTKPPEVAIEPAPPTRSKENKPTFKGTASEAGTVVVKSTRAPKRKAKKPPNSAPRWRKEMDGERDGHPPGRQIHGPGDRAERNRERDGGQRGRPFEVFTKPPTVTMEELAARSKENKPTFKGTASEPGQVTVHVYKGKEAKGTEATKLTATVGRQRRMVGLAGRRRSPDETYTASRRSRARSATNRAKANRADFESLHRSPDREDHARAERTLERQNSPTFEGEASETEPVTVHIYEGTGTSGTEVVVAAGDASPANTSGT